MAGVEYQLGGDVIIAINDQPVASMDDLLVTYLVEERRPGDEVTLTVIRPSGEEEEIEVVLAARPDVGGVTEAEE